MQVSLPQALWDEAGMQFPHIGRQETLHFVFLVEFPAGLAVFHGRAQALLYSLPVGEVPPGLEGRAVLLSQPCDFGPLPESQGCTIHACKMRWSHQGALKAVFVLDMVVMLPFCYYIYYFYYKKEK